MDNVQTMDLNESGASMMVPLTQTSPAGPMSQQQSPPTAQQSSPEKNIVYNSKPPPQSMDSTPIADIMSMNEVQQQAPQQMMSGGEDPRAAMMMQQQQAPQQMMMPMAAPPQTAAAAESKYPMNLTDEQVEALFVGVVAVIAFSKPLQEKLATMVPKFVSESGSRSTTGLAATGAVAAALFYFGRRFVLKN